MCVCVCARVCMSTCLTGRNGENSTNLIYKQ